MTTQLELPIRQPGSHRAHNMRGPSLEARKTFRGDLAQRQFEVLAFLKQRGPSTARQVMEGMGYKELNTVRPRLTELRKAGLILETKKTPDHVTGINVFVYAAL